MRKAAVIFLLVRERHVAFKERQHSLRDQASTRNAVDQHHFVTWLWIDASRIEDRSCQFQQPSPDLMLIDEEFRIYQISESSLGHVLDRNAEATLPFDQTCQEPTFLFVY